MKINLLLVVLCSTAILQSSCGTKKQITKEITYKSFKTNFEPLSVTREIDEGLKLTISPIDAKNINNELFQSSMLDGDYSKEHVTAYYKELNNVDGNSKMGKRPRKMLEKIFSQIDGFHTSGKISRSQAIFYKEKVYTSFILIDKTYGSDGSETELYKKENFAGANPYFSNGKYLSVYKLSFASTADGVKDVNINDFQILSENELLYPFQNTYFENLYEKEQEKLKTVYRINMPESIRIVKNQNVSKFFATPPVNPSKHTLVVNYIKDNSVNEFAFAITSEEQTNVINLDRYSFRFSDSPQTTKFNIIEAADYSINLKENEFFINRLDASKEFMLKCLSVNWFDGTASLRTQSFTPSNANKRIIKIDKKG
ncbi:MULTISPECIES: hypothetical protein [Sphingobacterium]|uniref:hypothetical protein n=1 Tax=Sphingobacterium TaxID=28453 RepID=UPI0013DA0382|nr:MULTISPECIES: hypothetical protein [unclassified Sphingobacterium]